VDRKELWRRVIRACTDHQGDRRFLRQLLVELWLHLRHATARDLNLFEGERESFDRRVEDLDAAMQIEKAPTGSGDFLDLAAFAAVLDRALSLSHSWIADRRNGYGIWSIAAGKPRKKYWLSVRLKPIQANTVRVGQRKLPTAVFRCHRVIPAITAGGVAVSIVAFPARYAKVVFNLRQNFAVAGGVFFDGVRLSCALASKEFVVRGLKQGHERRREQSIESHLTAAMGDPSVGLILYPEMSIPKGLEAKILASVRTKLQASDDIRAILIIPGSFHHRPEDRNVNSSSLYLVLKDEPPIELLRHRKFSRAWIPAGSTDPVTGAPIRLMEKIDPGTEISVIATPLGLWAIAICMDFCSDDDGVVADVWDALDVDLVFIPSLGNETTLRLHAKRLSKLWLRQPINVVLAQQMLPEEENRGVVMAGDGLCDVPLQNGFYRVSL